GARRFRGQILRRSDPRDGRDDTGRRDPRRGRIRGDGGLDDGRVRDDRQTDAHHAEAVSGMVDEDVGHVFSYGGLSNTKLTGQTFLLPLNVLGFQVVDVIIRLDYRAYTADDFETVLDLMEIVSQQMGQVEGVRFGEVLQMF